MFLQDDVENLQMNRGGFSPRKVSGLALSWVDLLQDPISPTHYSRNDAARGGLWYVMLFPTTQPKTPSLLYNRIEQCFAAHIVDSCQQYETLLLSLSRV